MNHSLDIPLNNPYLYRQYTTLINQTYQCMELLILLEVCSLQSRPINTYSGLVSYKYTDRTVC